MRHALVGRGVGGVGGAHDLLQQVHVPGLHRFSRARPPPDLGKRRPAQPMRSHAVGGKVQASAVEVLAHVPDDVGELHRVPEGVRALDHPPVPHAERVREPGPDHRRDPVGVAPQIVHGPVDARFDVHAHALDEFGGEIEGDAPSRHLAHHGVGEEDAGVFPVVGRPGNLGPCIERFVRPGGHGGDLVDEVVREPAVDVDFAHQPAFPGRKEAGGEGEAAAVAGEVAAPSRPGPKRVRARRDCCGRRHRGGCGPRAHDPGAASAYAGGRCAAARRGGGRFDPSCGALTACDPTTHQACEGRVRARLPQPALKEAPAPAKESRRLPRHRGETSPVGCGAPAMRWASVAGAEELPHRGFGGLLEPLRPAFSEHGGPDPVPEVLKPGLAGCLLRAVVQEVVDQLVERPELDPQPGELAGGPARSGHPRRQPRSRPEQRAALGPHHLLVLVRRVAARRRLALHPLAPNGRLHRFHERHQELLRLGHERDPVASGQVEVARQERRPRPLGPQQGGGVAAFGAVVEHVVVVERCLVRHLHRQAAQPEAVGETVAPVRRHERQGGARPQQLSARGRHDDSPARGLPARPGQPRLDEAAAH